MPLETISLSALESTLRAASDPARPGMAATDPQLRAWCAALESGAVLYFPQTPLPVPEADLRFLLGQQQTGSRLHKNIAYKPARNQLSGFDAAASPPEEVEHLRQVMQRYSAGVAEFLGRFLAPYQRRWVLDYASYRALEEKGRDLKLRQRNDLLHTDAFPTRPTRGWRILRFFHNIHPTRTRDWVVGEPFPNLMPRFAAGGQVPQPDSAAARAAKRLASAMGLGKVVPQWKRTPYDTFMMNLHNRMKEDEAFQQSCRRENIQFPPASSWMVYTETVPHAVLAGQYALEQTFLVDPAAMVNPGSAPIAVLEELAGARLA